MRGRLEGWGGHGAAPWFETRVRQLRVCRGGCNRALLTMRPGETCARYVACFWFFGSPSSEVTQGRAERNQFCRLGASWSRWRRIPTRTM